MTLCDEFIMLFRLALSTWNGEEEEEEEEKEERNANMSVFFFAVSSHFQPMIISHTLLLSLSTLLSPPCPIKSQKVTRVI